LNGEEVSIGSMSLVEERGASLPQDKKVAIAEAEEKGNTIIFVLKGKEVLGALALGDVIRQESREAIQKLQAKGVKVAMITGDSEEVARWVAKDLQIDEYFAKVLPDQKAGKVKLLQEKGQKVAMVGDGINDAPALAQADVGMAIGTGTDVAMEAADVTLMRGDLRSVPQAIKLSKATMKNIKENLVWAFGYNTVLIPIAAGVLAPFAWAPDFLRELSPILAAGAMAFSSISVVSNSLRLKRLTL
jgi:P-type Cu+ transporter